MICWMVGLGVELYLIIGGNDYADLCLALQALVLVIPEILFWFYGLWVWINGTFGHTAMRIIGLVYVVLVLFIGVLTTIWFFILLLGFAVFGTGKETLFQGIETFVCKQAIIVLPFGITILIHKFVWLFYYIKYYNVANRNKYDERAGINKQGNRNLPNPNMGAQKV